jgi:hypothetical protein
MKPHKLQTYAIALFLALAASAFARPLEFSELSLLVRAHESDSSVISIAASRKLSHPLTPAQEATLRAQGASDSLLRSLHNSNLVLSPAAATAYENASFAPAAARTSSDSALPKRQNVAIIDVAVDQPVNLSQWGGPDIDLAFRAREIVDTGRPELDLIETAGTANHYATYRGVRVPGWEPVDPEYTSIVAHTFARPLRISWSNPVRIDDVPYLLYPIYAVRGVSLYYIGRMSDDLVRVAVISG